MTEIIADTEKDINLAGKSIFAGDDNYTKKFWSNRCCIKRAKKGIEFTSENEDEAYRILAESHNLNVNTVKFMILIRIK